MNKKKQYQAVRSAVLILLLLCVALCCAACRQKLDISIQGALSDNAVIEYTGQRIQFPLGCVVDGSGRIVSYGVTYKVVNLADQSEMQDDYASFDLKTGSYQLIYSFIDDAKVQKTVNFSVQDTTSPTIEFLDIPNGLFLQDITEDTVNKLPLYSLDDASKDDGIELQAVLSFKGESDTDFREYPYRKLNNSYEVDSFGSFRYELTATDAYGNQSVAVAQWMVKDRDWKPDTMPGEGILADYSSEGYRNLIEGGDANQYYKIGNDYADAWLEEFEGAQGVLKIDLPFNNAVGWGNNTIRLRLPKSFTKEDLAGKYLAVRIYVEGEHIKSDFLFAGNNVEFRQEDATTRAFTTGVTGLKAGQWKTFYIEADTAEHIGMYPNATYNPNTTFYEGGDPADSIQLCFHREAGYFNDMTLYIDSISIAEFLPDTQITVSGSEATWTPVTGAEGYLVDLNGETSVQEETRADLPGEKGYIRVTPLGNGVTTLDAQTVTAVYGLDPGNSLAKFDDKLYIDLFTDQLKFSTDAEHNGYRPRSLNFTQTGNGLTVDIATGSWGVVTGIRFQFPKAQSKGSNTTLVLNMQVSGSEYDQIRVYDYTGKQLGVLKLDNSNTGKFCEFEIDISSYSGKLEGIQLIFGPNSTFTNVSAGVSVTFKDISLKNTYYPITVDGQSLMCAGKRKLTDGYTNRDVVQFTTFFNYSVPRDDTPLNFSGTVMLDGKKLESSAVTVVGYPNTDTICFKVPHSGKVLTILKGSFIYYNGIAVEVEETFNAKWNGSAWVPLANIPDAPAPEYVTLSDGSVKLVENRVVLEPGYTNENVVQFLNVYDFGVAADDTPLGFEGIVMLGGEKLNNPNFVGYPKNMTIALKTPHQGQVLTILEGAVIYSGDKAVVVDKTFNALWNGSAWQSVGEIPSVPETQYVTLNDGVERELVGKVTLTAGFTLDNLVQFTNVYDFGCPEDSTPIGFQGTVLLQGAEVKNPNVVGYLNSTTVGIQNLSHKGKVVTVMEGAYFYNDTQAVLVKNTFNALWDGEKWTQVDEIPEPPAKEYITIDGAKKELLGKITLTPGYTNENVVQFTNAVDFGVPADDTALGFSGTVLLGGKEQKAVNFVGYPNNTTICLKLPHKGQVLTVMADTVLWYGDYAVVVAETFNAKWDGEKWTQVDEIPEPPAKEYITVDGARKELMGKITLTPGYTNENVVQFTNAVDFGVPADDTALGFSGTVLLGGKEQKAVNFVGYPNNTTICLKLPHKGQVLTVMADTVLWYGDYAVVVAETFNAKWDGEKWTQVDEIPEPPAKEYITIDGVQRELVGKVELTAGFTLDNLVQFTNVYDFGCPEDSTPIGFRGTVLLQGAEVKNPRVVGYLNSTTVGIERISHKNKVVTIMEGSVFYNDTEAVQVVKTFNAKWDGEKWTQVDEIPEPEAPEVIESLQFTYRWGTANVLQVNTNLPVTTPVANFTTSDNGCSIDESGNRYQQVGWIQMHNPDETGGVMVLTFHFNSNFSAGQTYVLPAGAVFGFTDGNTYPLDKDYIFQFDGNGWTTLDEEPETTEPETTEPGATEPEEQTVSFQYRWGNSNTIQVNTNLPANTPCVNFTADQNGCSIDQSGNTVQWIGWVGMDNVDGTIVLTFHYNSHFTAGQTYVLPAGAVFGFTDGNTYELDANYTFTFNGTEWTMAAEEGEAPETTEPETTEPSATEPEEQTVSFQYRWGNSNTIQVNTNLPANTPCVNFTADQNGCSIDQSGNTVQWIGWVGMDNVDGTIVLTFHYNNHFTAGQTYVLPAGAIFGFTDGSTYELDANYTFTFNGTEWTMAAEEGEAPETTEPETTVPETEPETTVPETEPETTVPETEPETTVPETEPEDSGLKFQYRWGNSNTIQVNTNLPANTPCVNFTADQNGCSIDQSGNTVQWIGWVGMENVDGTIVLTFHYNSHFTAGQTYVLPAGAVFGFTDGNTYELDANYTFTFNGTEWTMAAEEGEAPETTEPETEPETTVPETEPETTVPETEPETTVPETEPEDSGLKFQYRWGNSNTIQVNTNLPANTPCVNFTADQNGCSIDQTGNTVQWIGWIGMDNVDGTIVLTFHYNSHFTAGQTYVLPAGAVFGFTDGNTYELDANYTFTFNGTEWTMAAEEPQEPETTVPETEPETTVPETEPEKQTISFQYRWGTANVLQVNTNLPLTTPVSNFTAGDNGCNIDQSGNQYQQVGWIQMHNPDETGGVMVLTFHFNSNFSAGQTYVLPAGAIFGFTDGSTYELDANYTFTFNGTEWTMAAEEPQEPETTVPETEPETTVPETEPEKQTISFQYRWGAANVLQVNTNLPLTTPVSNFTAGDNGCNIDQSGNQYQQVGWIQMHNPDETGGVMVLTFHFNSNFSAGQTYVLPAGAIFGFTDGNTYELDANYTFTFDGSSWTMSAITPNEKTVSFTYRYGNAGAIQVNTDLPADTPCQNFLVGENGCQIDESANQYHQVSWIAMDKVDNTIVLTFTFYNKSFAAGQTYFLPGGSIFGFTDGNRYTLDKDYTFLYNGTDWQIG